jgi:hypothetical protein
MRESMKNECRAVDEKRGGCGGWSGWSMIDVVEVEMFTGSERKARSHGAFVIVANSATIETCSPETYRA